MKEGRTIRDDPDLIENIDPSYRHDTGSLRAHRLINVVQDKVRTQMLAEMQVADEEAREKRLSARLKQELASQEFRKQ